MNTDATNGFKRTVDRRGLIAGLTAAALVTWICIAGGSPSEARAANAPVKIGIIGAGHIGSALAKLWVQAGHPVMLSSRHPDALRPLAQALGPLASVGTPQQAATYGDVVLVSVPYDALPEVGKEVGAALQGKVVLETGNPFPPGSPLQQQVAQQGGTGVTSAKALPGALLVRAFNKLAAAQLPELAHRSGSPVAIPIAADDPHAVAVAEQLVRDAGFEAVLVGPLATAKRFDMGGDLSRDPMNASEMRQALNLAAK
jgi:predicted dinucleotide-binding enzyme